MKLKHYLGVAIFWLMILGTIALLINGCKEKQCYSVIEDEVDKMCSSYDLFICGDIDKPQYSYTHFYDIREYVESIKYQYVSDPCPESYDYMLGDYKRGDCEDYVITLMEDLFMLGMIDNAKWYYGTYDGDIYHAWLIVNIDGIDYIFDSYYPKGLLYSSVKHKYNEIKIVMEK